MKQLLPLFALVLLIPVCLKAQSNYKPGYMVGLKGDTTRGFVDYREWDNNPSEARFKKTMTAGEEKLTPENALAFGIDKAEYYESYNARISQSYTDVAKLPVGVDTSYIVARVFLQRVAAGKNLKLYSYKDNIKLRFYVKERTDAKPEELTYQVYITRSDLTQIVNQPKFRNQLYLLAEKYDHDDNKLYKKIGAIEYDQPEIQAVVNKINGIAANLPDVSVAKSTQFFAGIGVMQSSVTYSGNIALSKGADGKAAYSPVIDMGVDLFPNPNVRRMAIRAEVSFDAPNYSTTTNTPLFARHTFNMLSAAITPQIMYNLYNTDKLKVFIDAGAAINFSAYSNNKYEYADEPYSGTYNTMKGYPSLNSTWVSFSGKAGVTLNNKIDIYVGYLPYIAITDHYEELSGAVNGVTVGGHYFFK